MQKKDPSELQRLVADRRERKRQQSLTDGGGGQNYVVISKLDVVPHNGYYNGNQAINYGQTIGVTIELDAPAEENQNYTVYLTVGATTVTRQVTVLQTQRFSNVAEFPPPNPQYHMPGHTIVYQPSPHPAKYVYLTFKAYP